MVFICRLCGKCDNELSGLAIFGEQGVQEAIAYKIKLSLDISVYEYDPLPKYICECCLGKLFTTFAFQESCRRVQILLRERFLSSKSWSPNEITPTAEVEELPNGSIRGTPDEKSVPESILHVSEDALHFCNTETAYSQNEISETRIRGGHGEMRNDVLAPAELNNSPSNVQTQMSCGSTKPAVENMQTGKNNRPELEVSQAETELNIFGEPFNFSSLLRNGVIQELVKAVGDRGYKKSNSRKTKKTLNSASTRSCRKKQKTNSVPLNYKEPCLIQTDNLTSTVSNVAVVHQTVNASDIHIPISSGIRSHELSRVDESHAKTSVGNSAETVHVEDFAMGDEVYIGPDLYETPQIVALVDVQKHAGPSQSEDIDSVCNNTLKIVDVFSTHEISSTSMPTEYVTDTPLYSSDRSNWHSPSSAENQSNSLSSSACSMQSPSKNPSNIRNWHTVSSQSPLNTLPSYTTLPSKNPQNSCKERGKVVDSGSTLNGPFPTEEEDEILVIEVVKANKDSIAKHWEKCPSGFTCKFCTKTYKRLIKCENHIRIHLGVKPYECHICKRRYHKKRLLNEHYSNHTGKKLYQCKECDKSFRYRKTFKIHAESHVAESSSSYMCEICGKTFSLQFGYWSHKTSKHVIVDTQTGVD